MTLKKNRNCFACRAYHLRESMNGDVEDGECELKYEQIKGIPQELCPKPLTRVQYAEVKPKELTHV